MSAVRCVLLACNSRSSDCSIHTFSTTQFRALESNSKTKCCLLIICGESFRLELEGVSEPAVDSDLPRLLDSKGSPGGQDEQKLRVNE